MINLMWIFYIVRVMTSPAPEERWFFAFLEKCVWNRLISWLKNALDQIKAP
jgi:hypothetical protein